MQSTSAEASAENSLVIVGQTLSVRTRIDDVLLLLGCGLLLQPLMSVPPPPAGSVFFPPLCAPASELQSPPGLGGDVKKTRKSLRSSHFQLSRGAK